MITLKFERDLEQAVVTTRLVQPDEGAASETEEKWGALGMEYARRVSETYTFELNALRDETPCYITIEASPGNRIEVTYDAREAQDTIGGLTSATLAASSLVYEMLREALGTVGHEDEDAGDWEGDVFEDSADAFADSVMDRFSS